MLAPFMVLPVAEDIEEEPASPELVELGRMLFHDPRLSGDGKISCNTCHVLTGYGTDGRKVSIGSGGRPSRRNTPSVFNLALQPVIFWDGRAESLEDQAREHLLDEGVMGLADEQAAERALRGVEDYQQAFAEAFPSQSVPVTFANVAEALAAFERRLLTPGRWDRVLGGEHGEMTAEEYAGLIVFVQKECAVCHAGFLLGGDILQPAAVMEPWPDRDDLGRAEVTGLSEDDLYFKVPSLRNVAETAPYFHDGSVDSLEEAVRRMGRHQLEEPLDEEEVGSISAFLRGLTGDLPPALP